MYVCVLELNFTFVFLSLSLSQGWCDRADGAGGEDGGGSKQLLLPPVQRVHRLQPCPDSYEVPAASQVQLLLTVVRPLTNGVDVGNLKVFGQFALYKAGITY